MIANGRDLNSSFQIAVLYKVLRKLPRPAGRGNSIGSRILILERALLSRDSLTAGRQRSKLTDQLERSALSNSPRADDV